MDDDTDSCGDCDDGNVTPSCCCNKESAAVGCPAKLRCRANSSQCNKRKVLTNHTGNSLAEATELGNREGVGVLVLAPAVPRLCPWGVRSLVVP